MINTIGIIGYGNFGKFVHELGERFSSNVEFRIHSRRSEIDNKKFFDLKTTSQSDIVILCDGINEYEERMKEVLKYALPETIFVDVATVKMHTNKLCRDLCDGRRFMSIHPMFGPSSYEKHNKDVSGFRIVVTDYALKNDTYQMLKKLFSSYGFSIIEMSAEEHDKNLADTLFITHYIAQSILKADFKRTEIDTLSFQFLMDAVESVKNDKELFKDVYKYNLYCKEATEKFHQAQLDVFKEL